MKTRMRFKIWVIAALVVTASMFGACGGGTSSPAPVATAAPVTTAPTTVAPTVALATIAPADTAVPTAATATAAPTDTPAPPAIDVAALLQARCTDCHNLNKVITARYTQEQWQQNVTRMVQNGAKLTAEEQTILVAYLAETYKP